MAIEWTNLKLLLYPNFPDLYDQMKMKFRISDEDLDILEEIIPLQQPYKAGKPWKFAGAFYYATTVLTTIGKKKRIWYLTISSLNNAINHSSSQIGQWLS